MARNWAIKTEDYGDDKTQCETFKNSKGEYQVTSDKQSGRKLTQFFPENGGPVRSTTN